MAEDLIIIGQNKEEKYISLLPQIKALCFGENNTVANLANISAALKTTFDFFWVGFYMLIEDELVLGPFQGPVACTRIKKGKGVCGKAWEINDTIIVDNVDEFPGHIACSSLSKSEIVIPLRKEGEIIGVLDVDSDYLKQFDEIDKKHLEELCLWIGSIL